MKNRNYKLGELHEISNNLITMYNDEIIIMTDNRELGVCIEYIINSDKINTSSIATSNVSQVESSVILSRSNLSKNVLSVSKITSNFNKNHMRQEIKEPIIGSSTIDLNDKINEGIKIIQNTKQIINSVGLIEIKYFIHSSKKINNLELRILRQIYNNPFEKIIEILLKLGNELGFFSLKDALKIIIGEYYKKIFNNDVLEKIKFYNKCFIPISFEKNRHVVDNKTKLHIRDHVQINDPFVVKKIQSPYECLMDNYGQIEIIFPYKSDIRILLCGYVCCDSMNILLKTSQICYPSLNQKSKNIHDYIMSDYRDIPNDFVKLWLRHCNLHDLILSNYQDIINKIKYEYFIHQQLKTYTQSMLNDEFSKGNLLDMFTIIKLLLFNNESFDDQSYANIECVNKINNESLNSPMKRNISEENTSDENNYEEGFLNIKNPMMIKQNSHQNKSLNIGEILNYLEDKKIGNNLVCMIIYKNLSNELQLKWKLTTKNFKQEFNKIKLMKTSDKNFFNQVIMHKSMPSSVKSAALDKIEEMKQQNNDYYKQLLYVKKLLAFPWTNKNDDNFFSRLRGKNDKSIAFLNEARRKLDDKIFGHEQCKDTVIELISKWISNPSGAGSIIGLVGPPGVGKTLIAKGISTALSIPFAQISLGGQNDGDKLHGHGYTYTSAKPGIIVDKMCEMGSSRSVLYFDELDKTSKKGETNEIYSILIQMTDPNTNDKFQDRFFQEVEFPLNKVVMVFSYNDSDKVDPILLDRIDEIDVKPYSTSDKIKIVQNFALKEVSEMVGVEYNSIMFTPKSIKYLIENYTNEAGVRDLKRKLEKIFLKINLDKIYQRGIFKVNNSPPRIITRLKDLSKTNMSAIDKQNVEVIDSQLKTNGVMDSDNIRYYDEKTNLNFVFNSDVKSLPSFIPNKEVHNKQVLNNKVIIDEEQIIYYLKKPTIDITEIHTTNLVGIVNGLYATSSGRGGIVPIQIYGNKTGSDESFTLRLTGCQGDVMKESVLCALTVALHAVKNEISEKVPKIFPYGYHIHAPNASTPKDGPSAGSGFAICFASRILNLPIKNDVALTGEIDLLGNVKKIGGLIYKLSGSKKAGVRHVLIPAENKEEYEKILIESPELFDYNFKITMVNNIKDIAKEMLIFPSNKNVDNYFI